jgi:hypothetical protein
MTIALKELPIVGAQTRGTRLSKEKVKKVITPDKGKKKN